VVECNLAKVEVAGSNPVSRSIFLISKSSRKSCFQKKLHTTRFF
jgi:hypothetical protein